MIGVTKCNCIVVKLPLKFMFNEDDVYYTTLSEFICTFLTLSRFNLLHPMMSQSSWNIYSIFLCFQYQYRTNCAKLV